MSKSQFIDWGSRDTHLMLNPKLPEHQRKNLNISLLPAVPAHIWLASSGASDATTPSLKLYALSKSSFLISAVAVNSHIQAKKKDIWLNALPLFHVGGLSIFARAFLSNSKVIDRGGEVWSAEKFHIWVNDSKATLTSLVPTQLYDLVKLGRSAPTSLRAVIIGGAKLDEELYVAARALGYRALPSYGMTECCSQIATAALQSLDANDYPKLEVLSHAELKSMDGGYIAVKSPALFSAQALWRVSQDDENLEILWRVGEWYVTQDFGDVFALAPDQKSVAAGEIKFDDNTDVTFSGQIVVPLGRDQDQLKISGELISLVELNAKFKKIIHSQAEVDFCIFSQPDPRRGAEIAIALNGSAYAETEEWVKKFNIEVLPVAKIRAAYFVDELPKSALGKIKLGELKAKLGF